MKVRKRSIIYALFIFLVLFFIGVTSKGAEDYLFFGDIVLAIVIVSKAQFSLLSIIAVLSNYMLANVYAVYRTGTGYGLLALSSHIYMKEMCLILLIFNVALIVFAFNSNVMFRERSVLSGSINIDTNTSKIFAILAIVFAYISFPGFNFGITTQRFQALLPGHFWNHVMLILMIISSQRMKDCRFVRNCIIFITIWVLFHGERVDIVGFYSYYLIKFCNEKGYKLNSSFMRKFGIVILAFFYCLIYIGETRVGGSLSGNITETIITSLLSQGTASDVGYVFNSGIDYYYNNSLLFGKTYITYIQGIIPFINQPLRTGNIIQQIYKTAGGEFFLIEPFINFGYIGVFVWINCMLYIIYTLLKNIIRNSSGYLSIVYCFIVATAFRYVWYGMTYIETGLLYLIPIAYIVLIMLKSKLYFLKGDKNDR